MGYASQLGVETGSWIPTFTGFSADPTVSEAVYAKIGALVTVNVRLVNGTSNATTFTMTLPFVGRSGALTQIFEVIVVNSGTQQAGRMDISGSSSNIATFFATPAGGAFGATLAKSTNFCVTYLSY